MKHGDIIKIAIGTFICEGTFVRWEDDEFIRYEDRLGNSLCTHYKSVVKINGELV